MISKERRQELVGMAESMRLHLMPDPTIRELYKYSFPILDTEKILEDLISKNVTVDESELIFEILKNRVDLLQEQTR